MHLGYLIGGQLRGVLSDTKFRTGKRSVQNSSGRAFTVVVANLQKQISGMYILNELEPASVPGNAPHFLEAPHTVCPHDDE